VPNFVAKSSEATGLAWEAPAAGGAYTSLASGTLSSTQIGLTGISQDYTDLYLVLNGVSVATATYVSIRLNNNSGVSYSSGGVRVNTTVGVDFQNDAGSSYYNLSINNLDASQSTAMFIVRIPNYTNTNSHKVIESVGYYYTASSTNQTMQTRGHWTGGGPAAITSIQIRCDGSIAFDAGNYTLYGVK